jgi:hypothetical protein
VLHVWVTAPLWPICSTISNKLADEIRSKDFALWMQYTVNRNGIDIPHVDPPAASSALSDNTLAIGAHASALHEAGHAIEMRDRKGSAMQIFANEKTLTLVDDDGTLRVYIEHAAEIISVALAEAAALGKAGFRYESHRRDSTGAPACQLSNGGHIEPQRKTFEQRIKPLI